MINEPVTAVFQNKNLECPEIEAGINEHTYWLWEYLLRLSQNKFTYKLFPYIGSYNPVITKINHELVKAYPKQLFHYRMLPPLLWSQLLLFGGVLNLIASKPKIDG
jgi:hypothetical protein